MAFIWMWHKSGQIKQNIKDTEHLGNQNQGGFPIRFCAERVLDSYLGTKRHVTHHTSRVARRTSHVERHQVTHHTAPTTNITSNVTFVRMSYVTRHTSHVTRHTAHITRHTSHVTRHTSHVTRHTMVC